MKKKNVFIISGTLTLALLMVLLWFLFANKESLNPIFFNNGVEQISIKKLGKEKAQSLYDEQTEKDWDWDWKISIRFYGKIVDQFGQPVEGAKIYMGWTDNSPEGSSERIVYSDVNGEFSLSGVRGKFLGVNIEREGYYSMRNIENQYSFEYANPHEDIYHEPDPKKPVKFLMRKKGTPTKLVSGKVVLQLPGQDTSGSMDFFANNGKGKAMPIGEGQLQVTTSKPQYPPTLQFPPYPYDWTIKLVFTDGGGFVADNDLFPFLAPESGYQATLDEKFHAVATSQYGRSFDRKFYFRIGKPPYNYGRIKISSDSSRDHTSISYSLNPTPGDRNLEPSDWK